MRFLHFALFEEPLLSLQSFVVDFAIAFAAAVARATGWTRARQMASQYGWLYRARGLLGWRADGPVS